MKKIFFSTLKMGWMQLLPFCVLILISYVLTRLILPFIIPTLELFHLNKLAGTTGGILLLIGAILLISLFVGTVVQTYVGKTLFSMIESKILSAIPGYLMLTDLLKNLNGESTGVSGEVALYRLYQSQTYVTLFVIHERFPYSTALQVCGGNPGTILVTFIKSEQIVKVEGIRFPDAFKTLISFGVGSNEILKKREASKGDEYVANS